MKTNKKLAVISSTKSNLRILSRPKYIFIAFISTIIASGLIFWSLNFEYVSYVLFESNTPTYLKIDLFLDTYKQVFTTYAGAQTFAIAVFSVLFGINIALLSYVIKNSGFNNLPKKSSATSFILAILGGGCVACGTSILAPIAITLGVGSSATLRDVSLAFVFTSSILICYSIYKLGLIISQINFKKS